MALALAVFAVVNAGCGTDAGRHPRAASDPAVAAPSVPRPVLIVSGKDDHGLLAEARVALLQAPRFGAAAAGEVDDGTLVRVLQARGEWHRVRSLAAAPTSGWIHDHSLRGTAHLRAPTGCAIGLQQRPGGPPAGRLAANAQVEMLAAIRAGGVLWVRVRALASRRADGWVRRDALDELPDRTRCVRSPSR